MHYNVNNYRKVEVETTDPIKLVIMLFEGAINFSEQAKLRMQDNNVAAKGILISKVMAIVSELQGSLNMKKGGEVAANMDKIYIYIMGKLGDANLSNNTELLDEVIRHFRVLKDAWIKASVKNASAQNQQIQPQQQKQAVNYGPMPPASGPTPVSTGEHNSKIPAIEIMG